MRDRLGLEVTTDSGAALALFEQALQEFLEHRVAAPATLEAALGLDPGLALARCLEGCLLRSMATGRVRSRLEATLALAAAERPRLCRRERLHLDALERWAADDLEGATARWRAIVEVWPRDLLAIRLLHHQGFWMGRRDLMRIAVTRALPAWHAELPGYGFLLGMLAFAHEEAGELETAERLARRALELNPEDMWSLHAVAHVLEGSGRAAEGAALLDHPVERWADRTSMRGHLFWHAALFEIERDRLEVALALYDRAVRPGGRPTCIDLHNAASLLARLEWQGLPVGGRWEELAELAVTWVYDHVYPWTDLHAALVLARLGRGEGRDLLVSLERLAAEGEGHAARVAGPLLVPIVHAIQAFYGGDPGRAVDLLLALGPIPPEVGGSNAQRDLLDQLLLEAALAAGRPDLARRLVVERLARRPHDRFGHRDLALAVRAPAAGRPIERPAASDGPAQSRLAVPAAA